MPRRQAPCLTRAGLLIVGLVLVTGPAWAQESERAETLIREANKSREAGNDSAAIPLLREAYKISRSPRTAGQLGLAEMALGYWVEAEQHLAEAVAGRSHPWVMKNGKVLSGQLDKARSHLGTLVIEGSPAGAEIRVNNRPAGNLPLPGPITVVEGEIRVELQAPGFVDASRTVTVPAGRRERLTIALKPVAVVAPAPRVVVTAPPPPPPVVVPAPVVVRAPAPAPEGLPAWRRVLPWGLVAGTAVAAGVGIWQHMVWQQGVSDFDAVGACGKSLQGHGEDMQCQSLYDHYAGARTRAFVGYGMAGLLGVGAAVAFVLNADAPAPAVGLGPGTVGLSLGGTF